MRKIMSAIATLALALAGLTVAASPAQASDGGCPESNIYGTLCLWKWIDFGGGRYQGGLNNIAAIESDGVKPDGCMNLTSSTFGSPHLGQPVNNESASMVIEPSVYNWKVRTYDWINCNESSAMYTRTAFNTYTELSHLGTSTLPSNQYHRITSVRVYQ